MSTVASLPSHHLRRTLSADSLQWLKDRKPYLREPHRDYTRHNQLPQDVLTLEELDEITTHALNHHRDERVSKPTDPTPYPTHTVTPAIEEIVKPPSVAVQNPELDHEQLTALKAGQYEDLIKKGQFEAYVRIQNNQHWPLGSEPQTVPATNTDLSFLHDLEDNLRKKTRETLDTLEDSQVQTHFKTGLEKKKLSLPLALEWAKVKTAIDKHTTLDLAKRFERYRHYFTLATPLKDLKDPSRIFEIREKALQTAKQELRQDKKESRQRVRAELHEKQPGEVTALSDTDSSASETDYPSKKRRGSRGATPPRIKHSARNKFQTF